MPLVIASAKNTSLHFVGQTACSLTHLISLRRGNFSVSRWQLHVDLIQRRDEDWAQYNTLAIESKWRTYLPNLIRLPQTRTSSSLSRAWIGSACFLLEEPKVLLRVQMLFSSKLHTPLSSQEAYRARSARSFALAASLQRARDENRVVALCIDREPFSDWKFLLNAHSFLWLVFE